MSLGIVIELFEGDTVKERNSESAPSAHNILG